MGAAWRGVRKTSQGTRRRRVVENTSQPENEHDMDQKSNTDIMISWLVGKCERQKVATVSTRKRTARRDFC
jgi:hypothetical protein